MKEIISRIDDMKIKEDLKDDLIEIVKCFSKENQLKINLSLSDKELIDQIEQLYVDSL